MRACAPVEETPAEGQRAKVLVDGAQQLLGTCEIRFGRILGPLSLLP